MLEKMRGFLSSKEAKESGRTKETAFTRKRKLEFPIIIGMLLNSLTKSLEIELDDFFEYVLESEKTASKQAFSKARQNINPIFLKKLAHMPVNIFYKDDNFRTFQGYRLIAVDGLTLELPDFDNLQKYFRDVGNKNKTVRAKASGMFDVENNIILAAEIDNYRVDERTLARRHLAELKEIGYGKDLLLYDRAYASREWLAYHINEGLEFVMRAKNAFLYKKTVYKEEQDFLQSFTWKDKDYTVRRTIIQLESGEWETLLSSPLSGFSPSELKIIYGKRWGIASEYYYLKHRLQIENFSGYTATAVLQDFYASVCLNNIASVFVGDAELDNNPKRKHEHEANRNTLLGKLKNRLIKALFMGGEAMLRFFEKLCAGIEKSTVPIRPERTLSWPNGQK